MLVYAASARLGAETGYDLWLRYVLVENATQRDAYRAATSVVAVTMKSPTGAAIKAELLRGLGGLLGTPPRVTDNAGADATVIVGTPASAAFITDAGANMKEALARVGDEGFVIRILPAVGDKAQKIVIASNSDVGAFHGVFHFLRLIQTGQPIDVLDIEQRPRLQRRLLNHWDNLNGSIERGYAGQSLWKWDELPGRLDDRIVDYARANASIGVNGTVLNNVNANSIFLTRPYLEKIAAIAGVLRPYGIRVYLSANPAAPKVGGGVPTADPLDPTVARWWKEKADEIYALIPDFGGFLVKANSEGQPGPQDYGRTHADGANVLADAVAPHGGIVMWRAFVYNAEVDPDRVKRANLEFEPLDGRFRDNVMVQVKNGPLDFMPREPFHPLFGKMPKTPLMAELQVTQEYLGQSTHLVYLAPMWKEFFDADTYTSGPGSIVARTIDGSLHPYRQTGIAGVANTGRDQNWTGHHFGQANWYAYGRLAWDPSLEARDIADEWIRMTWGDAPDVIATIRSIMLDSREAFVDYTMPLGLHHLIGGDHYAPMPENPDKRRADWSAIYYHRADTSAIGFDRTTRGSGAVTQYSSPLREQFDDPKTTPERFLLWFHRLPWDYRLASGRTLWEGLVFHYTRGVEDARGMEARWTSLKGRIDDERYQAVLAKLRTQVADASAWRDKCLRYFQQFSQKTFPPAATGGAPPP